MKLREFNLSRNLLKSIEFDQKDQTAEEKEMCILIKAERNPKKKEVLLWKLQIVVCPLKKLVSHFYKQVFIQNFDLSYNDGIGEYFAQFCIKYFDTYEFKKDP